MCIRINRRKFQRILPIQKRGLPLADISTIFQEKIDQTLEYRTPAWLYDILFVTGGSIHDHEKKIVRRSQ